MKAASWMLLGLAASLGACQPPTPESAPAAPSTPKAASTARAAEAPSSAPAGAGVRAEVSSLRGQGSALTSQVSGLNAQVSGLQGLVGALGGEIRGHEIHVAMPADTLFNFDSAQVREQANLELNKLAAVIAATNGTVLLVGHTDGKGAADYNQRLSEQRAQAVASWLAQNGVPTERLHTQGKGASEPLADNQQADGGDNPEGRARNRRVEAIIQQ